MQTLDWGHITTDSFNFLTKSCTHVYNHDLSSAEKVDRTIRFILGRLFYFNLHLPADSRHSIFIDIRGQAISDFECERILKEIKTRYPKPDSLDIHIKKD